MTEPPAASHASAPARSRSAHACLAAVRADLRDAERSDDVHRRRQYALAARDGAAEVLLDPQNPATNGAAPEFVSAPPPKCWHQTNPLTPTSNEPVIARRAPLADGS